MMTLEQELDSQIAQIIGFATSEAFEAGREFKGTWANSGLIRKYGWQVETLIARREAKAYAKGMLQGVETGANEVGKLVKEVTKDYDKLGSDMAKRALTALRETQKAPRKGRHSATL